MLLFVAVVCVRGTGVLQCVFMHCNLLEQNVHVIFFSVVRAGNDTCCDDKAASEAH